MPKALADRLVSSIAGAQVSAGFIRSCLEKAASVAAGTVRLIKTLLIASRVVGFDETTLRSGPPGRRSSSTAHSLSGTPCSTSAPGPWPA
jgi:3-methyladenine DNA glycosylase/8-oxoguanine DNA glycosylase